jgi:YnbE-like lipoprotein
MTLTNSPFAGYVWTMKKVAILLMAASVAACGGCVQIQAPDKPIEINLNVNIKQEVVYSLKKDATDLIQSNPELFPK